MPSYAEVRVRVRLLFGEKQSGAYFRGKRVIIKLMYLTKFIILFFALQENQRDLESATECLSEYLERDMTQENLADIKQKVQDKYR